MVFDREVLEKDPKLLESPLKMLPHLKSEDSIMKTPKQLRRSNSRGHFEDCEIDFLLSSGKNSHRKSSVMRTQLLRDNGDETSFFGGGALFTLNNRRNIFESHAKKASSQRRCL